MKVMIDTNIIISAVLFPGGKASSAMFKALLPPFKPLISDLILSLKYPYNKTQGDLKPAPLCFSLSALV